MEQHIRMHMHLLRMHVLIGMCPPPGMCPPLLLHASMHTYVLFQACGQARAHKKQPILAQVHIHGGLGQVFGKQMCIFMHMHVHFQGTLYNSEVEWDSILIIWGRPL